MRSKVNKKIMKKLLSQMNPISLEMSRSVGIPDEDAILDPVNYVTFRKATKKEEEDLDRQVKNALIDIGRIDASFDKKSNRIFVTSDTHFSHKMLVKEGHRKKGFEEDLIKKWNTVVKPEDTVIHLGDFSLGKYQNPKPLPEGDYSVNESVEIWRNKLNGSIILIRGNHDKNSVQWYMNHGFIFCADSMRMEFKGKKLLFSHEPRILVGGSSTINVHGHLHGNNHRLEGDLEWYAENNSNHIDVGVDVFPTPILLDTLVEKHAHLKGL